MQRRLFIKRSLLIGSAVTIGGGITWLNTGDNIQDLTINKALNVLNELSKQNKIQSTGEWKPTQIFNHLAQSIEYSLTGFPEHKSDLFKNTAGSLAFSIFHKRAKMQHPLHQPIPGAPGIDNTETSGDGTKKALSRLITAFKGFEAYQGELQPHFAYGELSKSDYTLAHVMHLKNHMEEITAS